jgi:hypothetical protein
MANLEGKNGINFLGTVRYIHTAAAVLLRIAPD